MPISVGVVGHLGMAGQNDGLADIVGQMKVV
jgi:hypothetical protein